MVRSIVWVCARVACSRDWLGEQGHNPSGACVHVGSEMRRQPKLGEHTTLER
jgi:hypothetical protein